MKIQSLLFVAVLLSLTSLYASAHEHQMMRIGEKTYDFVIGNLGEPVYVNDKSGVDLRVSLIDSDNTSTPVSGLEKTLKVEVSADGKSRLFDLKATWGTPGSYKTEFYPTVETKYSYRIFGTINDIPVEISSICNAAGHVMDHSAGEIRERELSEGVILLSKSGAFGCPQNRDGVNFPEPIPSNEELKEIIASTQDHRSQKDPTSLIALAVAAVALVFSVKRIRHKTK